MKYLRSFENAAEYNAAKSGSDFYRPCVSLIESNMSVNYDPFMAMVGDYLYSDLSFSTDLDSSKTPIAICVAPKTHFKNRKARWMSLVNMSATDPENGTTATGNNSSTNPGAGFCSHINGLRLHQKKTKLCVCLCGLS